MSINCALTKSTISASGGRWRAAIPGWAGQEAEGEGRGHCRRQEAGDWAHEVNLLYTGNKIIEYFTATKHTYALYQSSLKSLKNRKQEKKFAL